MTEGIDIEEVAKRLVIGRKRDGRSIYDERAKRELIQICLQPGVSLAKVARECGMNANVLSAWIRQHERPKAASGTRRGDVVEVVPAASAAFVELAVDAEPRGQVAATVKLQVCLPGGVVVDVQGCDLLQAGELLEAMGRLRCSASTKG